MLFTYPMSDEFVRGHIHRLFSLNQLNQTSQFKFHGLRLLLNKNSNIKDNKSTIEYIANTSNLTFDQYINSHSFLPLLKFGRKDSESVTPFRPSKLFTIQWMKSPRKFAYLCPKCVIEDSEYWTFSYWRRSHQLPGAFFCEKHINQVLMFIDDKNAFDYQPSKWVNSNKLQIDPNISEFINHETIGVFHEICQEILSTSRSWSTNAVRNPLKIAASNAGLKTLINSRGPLLSDLATTKLPKNFILELFPKFSQKVTNRYCCCIDDCLLTTTTANTGINFAFAACILFNSAIESFSSWNDQELLDRKTHLKAHTNEFNPSLPF